MKNLVCLTFLLCGSLPVCKAQSPDRKFQLGPQAGWGWSKIQTKEFTYSGGISAGLSGSVPIGGKFYLQPEVNFQQMGGKRKEQVRMGTNEYRKWKLRLTSIYTPVLLKYNLKTSGFSLLCGPQVGINLQRKSILEGYPAEKVKRWEGLDFAGVIGMEYRIPVSKTGLSVFTSPRYSFGLRDFRLKPYQMPGEEKGFRQSYFALLAGVRF